MKKRIRAIILFILIILFISCSYYFLPIESNFYFKSDITEFKKTLFPFSIISAIILGSLITFDKKEFTGNIWVKSWHILYVGIMCFIFFPMVSDTILTSSLRLNRLTNKENITENFIIIIKDNNDYSKKIVRGRLTNQTYKGRTDELKLNQIDYERVKVDQKIKLKLKTGLFGIPYNPVLIEDY